AAADADDRIPRPLDPCLVRGHRRPTLGSTARDPHDRDRALHAPGLRSIRLGAARASADLTEGYGRSASTKSAHSRRKGHLDAERCQKPVSDTRFYRLLEPEVLGDHHPLHLVRAFADLEDLLVTVEPRDRRLLHEAVAAVDLERGVRNAM